MYTWFVTGSSKASAQVREHYSETLYIVKQALPLSKTHVDKKILFFFNSQQEKLTKLYIPWAVYTGYRANFFMNLYVEKHFNEPLELLRNRLNVIPPPFVQKKTVVDLI